MDVELVHGIQFLQLKSLSILFPKRKVTLLTGRTSQVRVPFLGTSLITCQSVMRQLSSLKLIRGVMHGHSRMVSLLVKNGYLNWVGTSVAFTHTKVKSLHVWIPVLSRVSILTNNLMTFHTLRIGQRFPHPILIPF